MSTTPPGWYDDGHGALRWWDGAQWTEHVAAPDPQPAVADAEGDNATAVLPPELSDHPTEVYPGGSYAAGHPGGGYPTAYPGGYASGYPSAAGGAFSAATEPQKSRMWIVWVVLGVVLLGVVVGLAVLLPMLFLTLASGSGGSPQPVVGEYSQSDEDAAVDAVELYDQAYQTADCDAYFASTTESFREMIELPDCASFEASATAFAQDYSGYQVEVTSVEQNDASISVYTSETYTSPYDEDGVETEVPQPYEDLYEYVVVQTETGWAIDDAYID